MEKEDEDNGDCKIRTNKRSRPVARKIGQVFSCPLSISNGAGQEIEIILGKEFAKRF